jgi:hypothetical protein
MENFEKSPIIDPDNYDPQDYEIGQKVRYREGNKLLNAIIKDLDYTTGAVVVDFIEYENDENEEE